MRLIVIRHAQPHLEYATDTLADPGLTDDGARQAEALADALAGEMIDSIITSPLRRARETALPLAEDRGIRPQVHHGLTEMDVGMNHYIPVEQMSHPAFDAFRARLRNQAADEGLQTFRSTVVAAIDEITAAQSADATVALVCHGGTMNAYASSVLGLTEVFFFPAAYTAYSTFSLRPSRRTRLVSLNEQAHLRATPVRTGVHAFAGQPTPVVMERLT